MDPYHPSNNGGSGKQQQQFSQQQLLQLMLQQQQQQREQLHQQHPSSNVHSPLLSGGNAQPGSTASRMPTMNPSASSSQILSQLTSPIPTAGGMMGALMMDQQQHVTSTAATQQAMLQQYQALLAQRAAIVAHQQLGPSSSIAGNSTASVPFNGGAPASTTAPGSPYHLNQQQPTPNLHQASLINSHHQPQQSPLLTSNPMQQSQAYPMQIPRPAAATAMDVGKVLSSLSGQLAKADAGLAMPDLDPEMREKLLGIKKKLETEYKMWRTSAEQRGMIPSAGQQQPQSHQQPTHGMSRSVSASSVGVTSAPPSVIMQGSGPTAGNAPPVDPKKISAVVRALPSGPPVFPASPHASTLLFTQSPLHGWGTFSDIVTPRPEPRAWKRGGIGIFGAASTLLSTAPHPPDLSKYDSEAQERRMNILCQQANVQVSPSLEVALLEHVDHFLESIISGASRLAKARGSPRMEVSDVVLELGRWGLRVPGQHPQGGGRIRKPTLPCVHANRLAAITKAKRSHDFC